MSMKITGSTKIDPQQIMRAVLQRRPVETRFRLPLDKQQVVDMLRGAVMAEVAGRHHPFVESEALAMQISLMAEWLTNPQGLPATSGGTCVTQESKFWMLLCGKSGSGRTTLVRAVQQVINLLELEDDCGNQYGLPFYDAKDVSWMCADDHCQFAELCRKPMLAIDDLGTEPVSVQAGGYAFNPVGDLLDKRYDGQLPTIITTSMTIDELRGRYQERMVDRIGEMVSCIMLENNSYRHAGD